MKAPREYRNWLNRMRRKHGKTNGVISGGLLDNPWMESKLATSKRLVRRGSPT